MIDSSSQAAPAERRPWRVLAGYWLLILVGTHIPGESMPAGATTIDKPIHLTAYAGLGCLMAACMTPRGGRLSLQLAAMLVLVALCYGALDELTQPLFGRSCDFYDWIADGLGALIGVGGYAIWTRRRGSHELQSAQQEPPA